MMRRSAIVSFCRRVALALGLAYVANASGAASPAELDNAETNVCAAHGRVKTATAEAAQVRRGNTVPAESLAGRKIDDPARRGALQNKVDEATRNVQEGLVADARRDLARHQAEHRRLTGREFDTSLCDGTSIRTQHQRAFEAQQKSRMDARDAKLKASLPQTDQQTLAAFELDRACKDRALLDQTVPAGQGAAPDDVARVQRRYTAFVAAYEKQNGKPFDPALCRRSR